MSQPVRNRFYRTPKGLAISLFTSYVPTGSVLEEKGWTVEHPDGTRGLGRVAFETREEAQDWCDKHPNFPGMSQG